MAKRVYIYVNGIMTWPGDSKNWNERATTWTHLYTDARAEKLEYFSLPTLSRMIWQRDRMKKLATKMTFYQSCGWLVNLVGHSNGCDVIIDALRYMEWPKVGEVHLFSAACSADFEKLGVTQAQKRGQIEQVYCYCSGSDKALWLAGKLGGVFGYGTLGLTGPKNHDEDSTSVIRRGEFGHSDWFEDATFEETMRTIHHIR